MRKNQRLTIALKAAVPMATAAVMLGACAAPGSGAASGSGEPDRSTMPVSVTSATSKSGTIRQVVPSLKQATKPAVAFKAKAEATAGVAFSVSRVAKLRAQAAGPGEVSGEAVALTLVIENGSKKSVDLSSAIVTMQDGYGKPGGPISGKPAHAFAGMVPPDGHATAVYVFVLPHGSRNPLTFRVSYTTEAPAVLFVGSAK